MLQAKVCFASLERKDTYVQANIPINTDANAVSGETVCGRAFPGEDRGEASAPVRSIRILVSGSHRGVQYSVLRWRYTRHGGPTPTALGHRDPHWRFAAPGTVIR